MFLLALKGVRHYFRTNVVVMLAVAISTAVIGGSLIIGDSVRYSLREMTFQRLGHITDVLQTHRFFRQQLADEIQREVRTDDEALTVAPALLVTAAVEAVDADRQLRRAGSVTILATDDGGWRLLETADIRPPQDRQIVLGHRTAADLNVAVGDEVTVWVEVPSSIPRDSLLGEREEVSVELAVAVSAIIPEDVGASRFNLNPGQQLPYSAFLSLQTLQERLGIEEREASRRNPVARPARVNTILAGYPDQRQPTSAENLLTDALRRNLNIEDIQLRLRQIPSRGYISVETDRMILEDPVADAAFDAAESLGLNTAPAFVYLSNEIYAADRTSKDERYSMYSIIGATKFDAPPPLGPFRLVDGSPVPELTPDDILLSLWLSEDLQVKPGDKVVASWHEVGSHGELPEVTRTFVVKGILAEDAVSVDPDLTPYVEGVTDVEDFSDVDQPFEMDMDRLTERDDEYWDLRRATPKAFVSLQTANQLWHNRYGRFTSIRVAPASAAESQLTDTADRLAFEIARRIDPRKLGFMIRPVLLEGLAASVGANDFSMLFLGFSFFLILSAIILAWLMFRLGVQRRIQQFGLLTAIGWPSERIHRLFLLEGVVVCAAGAIPGIAAAVGFAKFMIYGLTTWWSGAVGTRFLLLDIQPSRLAIAATVSLVMTVVIIWRSLRSLTHLSIRSQLTGDISATEAPLKLPRSRVFRALRATGVVCLILAISLPALVLAGLVPQGEAFMGLTWEMVCFFVAGFACLSAGLWLLSALLYRRSAKDIVTSVTTRLGSLAVANAARNPTRSMLTTALIAFATFVIVAVAAGRRNPLSEAPDINSGNGGFTLVGETAQPVLYDLNTRDGRIRTGLTGRLALPDGVRIFGFAVRPGEDASCVNLYRTRIPTLLGATDAFIERGGFRFADTAPERWKLLKQKISSDGLPVIPVIGDMNTVMYNLKQAIGGRIRFPDDEAPVCELEIVGLLDGSVLQGVLVMSEDNLRQIAPEVTGFRYFLIETPDHETAVRTSVVLETALNNYGMDVESVAERLAGFLAVQNTYLSTFQFLGGLGLLVGTFGLAAAMVRNVIERRKEIALMRAVGFTVTRIGRLVVTENSLLLFWGIALGTISALLAMLPHLKSTGGDVPWPSLAMTLLSVAAFGSLSAVIAVRTAASLPIRENLAAE